MKRCVFIMVLSAVFWSTSCMALTIRDLLDAVERQPGYKVSEMSVHESKLQKERATAALYPKLELFGRFESYNSPTNLRPLPPTEVNVQAGESIPFSREILRYGLSFEAPLYVRELYVLQQKMMLLRDKAKVDHQLDLLGRQASVVSLNSALAYFQALEAAIDARRTSLAKTLEDMSLKVKTGRAPESELLKIEKVLNDLDQQRNDVEIKRLDTLREIQTLTGMELTAAVDMNLERLPDKTSNFLSVIAEQYNTEAAEKELQRRRATRWPTLWITGSVSGNDGEAYNTDKHIHRDYNQVALMLKFPLFDRTLSSDESIARVQLEKAKRRLEQTRLDVLALADTLDRKIKVIENSIAVAEKSVNHSQKLLTIAKVALQSGRITTEEYLRYESDVLAAQASLYQARQQMWQIVAQQAVLYGTDLRGVVK